MKNLIKIFTLSLVLAFASCGETENVTLDIGDGFVQFAASSSSVQENSTDPITIDVLYGGSLASNTNGINVKFTLEGADASRFTITPANGTLQIPAGEASASISILPIDNNIVDGNSNFSVVLSPDSDKAVGIGGQGINNSSFALTIVDNDCPVDINGFVGTYTVFENFTGGGNAPSGLNNFFGESYQLEMTLAPNDPSGTKLIVNNSPGFDTYIANGTVLAFDTCNGKVTFDSKSQVEVALFRTFVYTDSGYDESDFIIEATGPLATFGPYQFTFTKQ
jgi:hypothetical protein